MALGTLSDAYLEMGRYDEAITAAQKMMDMKPSLPSYTRASYLAWLRGDEKAALENIHEAIDAGKDPKDPEPRCWAMVQAAMIFWHKGDYAGADAGFNAALKECPDYPPALVGRGRVALGAGDFARAREVLEQAFKREPARGDGLAARRRARRRRRREGRRGRVRAGRQDRPHVGPAHARALLGDEGPGARRGAASLVEAEKKVRDDIYTEDALAWALYRLGRFADASAASEKATAPRDEGRAAPLPRGRDQDRGRRQGRRREAGQGGARPEPEVRRHRLGRGAEARR